LNNLIRNDPIYHWINLNNFNEDISEEDNKIKINENENNNKYLILLFSEKQANFKTRINQSPLMKQLVLYLLTLLPYYLSFSLF